MAKNICKATVWPVSASGIMDKSVFFTHQGHPFAGKQYPEVAAHKTGL
ncbi:hypothetical protein [Dysosmobacter welbionis]